MNIPDLQQRLRAFSDARHWEPYQTPKNLAMAMVVEAAELLEIFQWLTPEESQDLARRPEVQQHLGEEVADVLTYLLQIADRCGIDIEAALERKWAINAQKYPPHAQGPKPPVPVAAEAPAAATASAVIPVLDYTAPDTPQRFVASLRDTGFAVLTHHPIAQALVEQIYAEWSAFFDSPARHGYAFEAATQDGYVSPALSETAKGRTQKDLKEFFHLYPQGRYPAEVSDAARRYRAQAEALAAELLAWVDAALPDDVRARLSMPLPQMIEASQQNLLRVLRYPPLTGDEPEGAVRAAAHEDINLLTVLPAASEPGLQVLGLDGAWREVPCDFGMLVINTGDMLQEATGGWLPSTTHRVVNPSGPARLKPRVSLPLFLHPRPEVRLSDRHTAGSYLAERLRELGLKA